jgi:DNA processing protein
MTHPEARRLSETERRDWLRLIRSETVGPITFFALLRRFGTARAALDALPDLARRGGRRTPIKIRRPEDVELELEATAAIGARMIAHCEPDYPPLLAEILDAPPLICVRGDIGLLGRSMVAMVGSRNASLNGRRFARGLAEDLGGISLVIASGLARGIDTAAHLGALKTGTVAVVAGGIDVVYPEENRDLYDEIVARGVAVSEVAMGVRPQARHFPRRNRLISGLARGVVVVEANMRSGSLITARTALEQGREVFAVPGSPLDPRARGTNDLIRQGAILTESAADVRRALDEMMTTPAARSLAVDTGLSVSDLPGTPEMEAARRALAETLSPAPVTVDEIIRTCQLSPPVVMTVLLEWELAGRLERHPGNKVSLVAPV